MRASDELRAAKAVLLERGWFQGDYENPKTGEVCIVGALNAAGSGKANASNAPYNYNPQRGEAAFYLNRIAFLDWCQHISQWNDQRGRTPEEALAFFDRAIALAEADEANATIAEPLTLAEVV